MKINITLNGKVLALKDGSNIQDLIEHLKLLKEKIAVEINHEIIPKSEYLSFKIQANDRVEIVNAVGGG